MFSGYGAKVKEYVKNIAKVEDFKKMKYKIYMTTTKNREVISGWYTGTGFGITTNAKKTHLFTNKDFAEHIAEQLAGRKIFLNEIIHIKTKVLEED